MSNLKVEIGLNRCGECEKYNKGIEIHEMFNWENCSINKDNRLLMKKMMK